MDNPQPNSISNRKVQRLIVGYKRIRNEKAKTATEQA